MAIQGVFCYVGAKISKPVEIWRKDFSLGVLIDNRKDFVDKFFPNDEDADIATYVALFIIVVFHNLEKVATEDISSAVLVTRFVKFMFEGVWNKLDVRYAEVLNDNAANKFAIHSSMNRIYALRGREQNTDGGIIVLTRDKPTFCILFWSY